MIIWLSAALWLTLVTFINQPIDLFVLFHFPDAGDGADQADYTNKDDWADIFPIHRSIPLRLQPQLYSQPAVEMPRGWSAVYRKDTTTSNSIK
jgi:hypothetical protein